jgi:hypothetical protein
MKQIRLILFVILVILFIPKILSISISRFEEGLVIDNLIGSEGENFDTISWIGQTFTTTENIQINRIRIRMSKSGIQSGSIEFYNTSGGFPTGSALVTINFNSTQISSSPGSTELYLSFQNLNLSANTKYAIVIKGSGSQFYINSYVSYSNSLSNGNFIWTSNSGGTWNNENSWDLYFGLIQQINQTVENLTFNGNENITRYLFIPSSVSALTNGFLNLSGYVTNSSNFTLLSNFTNASFETSGFSSMDANFNTYAYSFCDPNFCNVSHTFLYNMSVPDLYDSVNLTFKYGHRQAADGNNCNQIHNTTVYVWNYTSSLWSSLYSNMTNWTQYHGTCPVSAWDTTLTETRSFFLSSGMLQNPIRIKVEQVGKAGSGNSRTYIQFYERQLDWFKNLNNVSLKIDNQNLVFNFTGQFNQTNNRTSNFASTINRFLNATYLIGSNYIIPFVFHSDTAGVLQYSSLLFHNQGFIENSQTYTNQVHETERTTFLINISYDPLEYTTVSGTLVYNNTRTTGDKISDGSNFIFSVTKDIPLVTNQQNISFYWEISLTNLSSTNLFNSTTKSQIVNRTYFEYCNATYTNRAVNYSVYDESSLAQINFSATALIYWRINEDSLIKRNKTFILESNISHQFCMLPSNKNYYTSPDLLLSSSGYDDRRYTFNLETYNSTITERLLYLLNNSLSSRIILQILDSGLVPLEGYTIKIYRINPLSGEIILVEQDITNNFGQSVAKLVQDNIDYDIKIYDKDGNLVKSISNTNIVCLSSSCVINIVLTDTINDFSRFDYDACSNIDKLSCSLVFNNITNFVTFSWSDNTGDLSVHRLFVEKLSINGTSIVCNNQSSVSSGVITCNLGSSISSYRIQSFRKVGTKPEIRVGVLNIKVGDEVNTFGREGMIWSFLLLFTLITLGLWSPGISFMLYFIGMIMLGLTGIVYINPAIMIATAVIGGLAIWALKQ